jgi:hypothetical protein
MNRSQPPLKETDLYRPIADFLTDLGYIVRGEVKGCDLTAILGDELIVVELKLSINLTLLLQATQRQRVTDSVYVAVPRPKGGIYTPNWRHICHLLRRLELGLILVSFTRKKPRVEVVFHPQSHERQRNKKARRSIIKEAQERTADLNIGGSTKKKLMTAYRENSIQIACFLERLGTASPKQLRALGTGEKTQSILANNFYGWFERIEKGTYSLNAQGQKEMADFPELTDYYRRILEEAEIKE